MNEKIKQIIDKKIFITDSKKKLKCTDAYEISSEMNISLKKIGEYCNSEDIKIVNCQLNCF